MRAVVRRALYGSALLVFMGASPGCTAAHHEGGHFRRASLKDVKDEVDDLKKVKGEKDVLLIPVLPDGTVFPKTIVMKADYHAILWFSLGSEDLTVDPRSYDPTVPDFPQKINCKKGKGICSTPHIKKPKEGDPTVFGYSGSVGPAPGKPLDPRIEIVN